MKNLILLLLRSEKDSNGWVGEGGERILKGSCRL